MISGCEQEFHEGTFGNSFRSISILVSEIREIKKSSLLRFKRQSRLVCFVLLGGYQLHTLEKYGKEPFPAQRSKSFDCCFQFPLHGESTVRFELFDDTKKYGTGEIKLSEATEQRPCYIGEIPILNHRHKKKGVLLIEMELKSTCIISPFVELHHASRPKVNLKTIEHKNPQTATPPRPPLRNPPPKPAQSSNAENANSQIVHRSKTTLFNLPSSDSKLDSSASSETLLLAPLKEIEKKPLKGVSTKVGIRVGGGPLHVEAQEARGNGSFKHDSTCRVSRECESLGSFASHGTLMSCMSRSHCNYKSVALTIHRYEGILHHELSAAPSTVKCLVRYNQIEENTELARLDSGDAVFESTVLFPFKWSRMFRFLLMETTNELRCLGWGKLDLKTILQELAKQQDRDGFFFQSVQLSSPSHLSIGQIIVSVQFFREKITLSSAAARLTALEGAQLALA